jgi:dTDP-4-dehydrorhamnose reductase
MKILILGANGMLGSRISKTFSDSKYKIFATLRKKKFLKIKNIKFQYNINVTKKTKIKNLLLKIKPDVVINCTGFIKQKDKNNIRKKSMYYMNSTFPIFLDLMSKKLNFYNIHFSTDCVFDGKKKMYSEKSKMNAKDDYGKSKILAEKKIKHNTLVIRTSIIGHELNSKKYGLLEWFLNSGSKVEGYSKVFFSGLSTNELSKTIKKIIDKKMFFTGTYNISSKRISKYSLLAMINSIYKAKKIIINNKKIKIDRSLNSKLFKNKFGIKINSWKKQILEMNRSYKLNK